MAPWRIHKVSRGWWNIEHRDPHDGIYYAVATCKTGESAFQVFRKGVW